MLGMETRGGFMSFKALGACLLLPLMGAGCDVQVSVKEGPDLSNVQVLKCPIGYEPDGPLVLIDAAKPWPPLPAASSSRDGDREPLERPVWAPTGGCRQAAEAVPVASQPEPSKG